MLTISLVVPLTGMIEFTMQNYSNSTEEPINKEDAFNTELNELKLMKVAIALWTYVPPIIITVGVIGNSLAVLVLSRKKVRKNATVVFLISLAFSDTSVLLSLLLENWLRVALNIRLLDLSAAGCKIHQYFVHFAGHMAAWILVLVSVERLIAVYFPMRHKLWFTWKRAIIMITILCLSFLLYDSSEVVIYHLKNHACVMNENFQNVLVVKMGLAIFLFSTGPLVVMCTITVAIVAKLVLNRKKGKQKVAALTGTMVTVNAAFFVTTLPFTIHVLTFKTMKPNRNMPQEVAKL